MLPSGTSSLREEGSPQPTPPHSATPSIVDIPPISEDDDQQHQTSITHHSSNNNTHYHGAADRRRGDGDDVALRPVPASAGQPNGSNTNNHNLSTSTTTTTTTRVRKQLLSRTRRSVSCLLSILRFFIGLPMMIINGLRLFVFEALCDGPLWARGLNLVLMVIIVVLVGVLSGDLWRFYTLHHHTPADSATTIASKGGEVGSDRHRHHSVFFAGSGGRDKSGTSKKKAHRRNEDVLSSSASSGNLPKGEGGGGAVSSAHRKQVVGGLLNQYKDSISRRPTHSDEDNIVGGAYDGGTSSASTEGPIGHVVYHEHPIRGNEVASEDNEEDAQLLPPTSIHNKKKYPKAPTAGGISSKQPWWRRVIDKGSSLLHLGDGQHQKQLPGMKKPHNYLKDEEEEGTPTTLHHAGQGRGGDDYGDDSNEGEDNTDQYGDRDAAQDRADNEAILLESYKKEIASVRSKIDRLERFGKRHQKERVNGDVDADITGDGDDEKAIDVSALVNELHDLRLSAKRLQNKMNAQSRLEKEYDFLEEQDRHRDWKHDQLRKEWAQEKRDVEEGAEGDDTPRSLPHPGLGASTTTLDVAQLPLNSGGASSCPGLGITNSKDTIPSEIATPFLPYPTYELIGLEVAEFAYVTFVTSHTYVQQAATLMYSIAVSGSVYSRCVLISKGALSKRDQQTLSLFARVIEVDAIPSPLFISNPQYVDTFTKLRIWELEPIYRKVLYIDSDVIIKRSLDHLFDIDAPWVVPMDAEQSRYSTGMMLLEPSLSTFDKMMVSLKRDVTGDMMLLPDLLFLKNFFEKVMPREAEADNDALMAVYQQAYDAWRQRKGIFESQVDVKEKEFNAARERRIAAGDTGDYDADGAYRSSYFFRPSFTEPAPSPPPKSALKPLSYITLMSRWYQVYQEEFGIHYASFMSRRRQKITIHDPRVFGIHYPGNTKPWNGDFEGKFKRFSAGFCVWPVYQREFMMGVTVRARRFAPEDELFWDIRKKGEKNAYTYWGTDGEKLKKQQDQSERRIHLRSLRHVDQAEGAALSIRTALQVNKEDLPQISHVVGSQKQQRALSAKHKKHLAEIDKRYEDIKTVMRPFDYEPAFWWFLYYKMMLNSLNTLAMNAVGRQSVKVGDDPHRNNGTTMGRGGVTSRYTAKTLEEFADGHLDTVLSGVVGSGGRALQNKQRAGGSVFVPNVRGNTATTTGGGGNGMLGGPDNADAFFSAGINAEDDLRKQGDRGENMDGASRTDDESSTTDGGDGASSSLTSLETQRIDDALSALVFLENEKATIQDGMRDNAATRGRIDQMDASYNTALDVFAPPSPSTLQPPPPANNNHPEEMADSEEDGSVLRVVRAAVAAYLKRRRWFTPKYPALGIRSDITRPLISFLPRSGVKLTDVVRIYRAYTQKESEVMQLIESERKRAAAMQGALDGLNSPPSYNYNNNNNNNGWQQNTYNNNQYTTPSDNYYNANLLPPKQQPLTSIWDEEWRSAPWAYYLHKAFPELSSSLLTTDSSQSVTSDSNAAADKGKNKKANFGESISATTFNINVASKRVRDSLRVPKIEFTLPDVTPTLGSLPSSNDVEVRLEHPGAKKNEEVTYIRGEGGVESSLLRDVYAYMFGIDSNKIFLQNIVESLTTSQQQQKPKSRCAGALVVNTSTFSNNKTSSTATLSLRMPLVIRAPILRHIEAHMVQEEKMSVDGDTNMPLLHVLDNCRRAALEQSIWPLYRQHLALLRSAGGIDNAAAEVVVQRLQDRMAMLFGVSTVDIVSLMESLPLQTLPTFSSYSSAATSASTCKANNVSSAAAAGAVNYNLSASGEIRQGSISATSGRKVQKSLTALVDLISSEMEACSAVAASSSSTAEPMTTLILSGGKTSSAVQKWWNDLRASEDQDDPSSSSPFIVFMKDAPVVTLDDSTPTSLSDASQINRRVSVVVRLGASASPSPVGGTLLEHIASLTAARWESEAAAAATTPPVPTTTTPAPYYWGKGWGASPTSSNLPDLPELVEIELITSESPPPSNTTSQQLPPTMTTLSSWVPRPPALSSRTTMPPSQAVRSTPFIEVSFKGKVLMTTENTTLMALLGSVTDAAPNTVRLEWAAADAAQNALRRRLNGLQKTLRGLYGLAGWNRETSSPVKGNSSSSMGDFDKVSYTSMLSNGGGGSLPSLAHTTNISGTGQQHVHHYTTAPRVQMLTVSLAQAKRAYSVYTSKLRAANNALCLSLQPVPTSASSTNKHDHQRRVVSVVVGGQLYKCAAVATSGFLLQKDLGSPTQNSRPSALSCSSSLYPTALSSVGAPVTFEAFLEAVVEGKRGGVVVPQHLRTPHHIDIIRQSYDVGQGSAASTISRTAITTFLEGIVANTVFRGYMPNRTENGAQDNNAEDDSIVVAILGSAISTVSHAPITTDLKSRTSKNFNSFTTVLTCPAPKTTTENKKDESSTSMINLPGELALVTPSPTSTTVAAAATTLASDTSSAAASTLSSSETSDAKYWREYAYNNNIKLDSDNDIEEDEDGVATVGSAASSATQQASTTAPPALPTFTITLPYNISWSDVTASRLLVTLSSTSSSSSGDGVTTAYIAQHHDKEGVKTATATSSFDANIMKAVNEARRARNVMEKRAEDLHNDVLGMLNQSRLEELLPPSNSSTHPSIAFSPLNLYFTATTSESSIANTNSDDARENRKNAIRGDAPSESLLSALLARSLQELSSVIDEPIHTPLSNISREVSKVSVQLKASLDNARTIIMNAASTDNIIYMSSALETLQTLNITSRSILEAAENFTSVDNVRLLVPVVAVTGGAGDDRHGSSSSSGIGNLLQSPHLGWLLQKSERDDPTVRNMYNLESIMESCHVVASNIVNKLQNREDNNNDDNNVDGTRPGVAANKKNNNRRQLTQLDAYDEGRILGGGEEDDMNNAQNENDNQRALQNEQDDDLARGEPTAFAISHTSASSSSSTVVGEEEGDTTAAISERKTRTKVLRGMRQLILSIVADVVPELQRQTYLLDCLKMRIELIRNTLGKRIAYIGKLELRGQSSKPSLTSNSEGRSLQPKSGVVYDVSGAGGAAATNTGLHHAIFVESVSACQLSKEVIRSLIDDVGESASTTNPSITTTTDTTSKTEGVVHAWIEHRWQMSKVAALRQEVLLFDQLQPPSTGSNNNAAIPQGVVDDFKSWKRSYLLSESTSSLTTDASSLKPVLEQVLDQIAELKDTWKVQDEKLFANRAEEDLDRMEQSVVAQARRDHTLLVKRYTTIEADSSILPASQHHPGGLSSTSTSASAVGDAIVLGEISGSDGSPNTASPSPPRDRPVDPYYSPPRSYNNMYGGGGATSTTMVSRPPKVEDKYLMIPLLEGGYDASSDATSAATTTTKKPIEHKAIHVGESTSNLGGDAMANHQNMGEVSPVSAGNASLNSNTSNAGKMGGMKGTGEQHNVASTVGGMVPVQNASVSTTSSHHLGGMLAPAGGADTASTTAPNTSSVVALIPAITSTPPLLIPFTTLLKRYVSQNLTTSPPPSVIVERLEHDLVTTQKRESELQELLFRPSSCTSTKPRSSATPSTTLFDRCEEVLQRSCRNPESWVVPTSWPTITHYKGSRSAEDGSLWLPELVKTINEDSNIIDSVTRDTTTYRRNSTMPAALVLLRDSLRVLLEKDGSGVKKSCNTPPTTSSSLRSGEASSSALLRFCSQYVSASTSRSSSSSSYWVRVAKQGTGVYVVSTDDATTGTQSSSSSSSSSSPPISDRWGTILSKTTRIALLNAEGRKSNATNGSTQSTPSLRNQLKRDDFGVRPFFTERTTSTTANRFWTPAARQTSSSSSSLSTFMSNSIDLSKWAFTRELKASLHTLSLVPIHDNATTSISAASTVDFNLTVTVAVRVNMSYPVVQAPPPPPAAYSPYYYRAPSTSAPSNKETETVVKKRKLVRKSILLRLPLPPPQPLHGDSSVDNKETVEWHSELRTSIISQIGEIALSESSNMNSDIMGTTTIGDALLYSFVAPQVSADECLRYTETTQGPSAAQNEQPPTASTSSTALRQLAKLSKYQLRTSSVNWNPLVAHRQLQNPVGKRTLEATVLRGPGGTLTASDLASLPHRTLQYFDEVILGPTLDTSLLNYTTATTTSTEAMTNNYTSDLFGLNKVDVQGSTTTATHAGRDGGSGESDSEQRLVERALNRAINQMGEGRNVLGDDVVADALKKALIASSPRDEAFTINAAKYTSPPPTPPPTTKHPAKHSSASPTNRLRSAVVELLRGSILAISNTTMPAQATRPPTTTTMRSECVVYNLHSHRQAHTLNRLPLFSVIVPGGGIGDPTEVPDDVGAGRSGSSSITVEDVSRHSMEGCGGDQHGERCKMGGFSIFVNAI